MHHPGGLCHPHTFYFPCKEWLIGPPQGPKNCKELHVSSGVDASGRCTYQVQVFTADQRGAGTDGDVFLSLIGMSSVSFKSSYA